MPNPLFEAFDLLVLAWIPVPTSVAKVMVWPVRSTLGGYAAEISQVQCPGLQWLIIHEARLKGLRSERGLSSGEVAKPELWMAHAARNIDAMHWSWTGSRQWTHLNTSATQCPYTYAFVC